MSRALCLGDIPQQPAHDLARPRLGQIGGEQNVVGSRDGADLPGHVVLQDVDQIRRLRRAVNALPQCDERGDRLTFDFMSATDDCSLGDARVIDQRALDSSCRSDAPRH